MNTSLLRRTAIHSLLFSVLCSFCLTVSAGQIYKWVDDKGVTHFSAQKPPAKRSETVTPRYRSQPAKVAPMASGTAADQQAAAVGASCSSKLCQLVATVDPNCATSLCDSAKLIADDCFTISCQSKRAEVKKKIAQKQHNIDYRERMKERRIADPIAGARDTAAKQRRATLIAKCKANHGINCENSNVVDRMVKKDTPLTDRERQAAMAERRQNEAMRQRNRLLR